MEKAGFLTTRLKCHIHRDLVLSVMSVARFAYGGVSFRECLRRADRIPLPEPYKLLTKQQFRDFVSILNDIVKSMYCFN